MEFVGRYKRSLHTLPFWFLRGPAGPGVAAATTNMIVPVLAVLCASAAMRPVTNPVGCHRLPRVGAARMVNEGDGLQTFALSTLKGSSGNSAEIGAERSSFCAALQRDSVAIVSLPASALPAIADMWTVLHEFDELESSSQRAFGPIHQAPYSKHHLDQDRKVGFTGEFKNYNGWCIDTRLRRVSDALSEGDGNEEGFEILPEGLDKALPGVTSTLNAAQDVLHDLAMTALHVAVRASSGAQDKIDTMCLTVGDLSDAPAALPLGASSATTHRLVKYAADVTNSDAFGVQVAFAAHTDSTWCFS